MSNKILGIPPIDTNDDITRPYFVTEQDMFFLNLSISQLRELDPIKDWPFQLFQSFKIFLENEQDFLTISKEFKQTLSPSFYNREITLLIIALLSFKTFSEQRLTNLITFLENNEELTELSKFIILFTFFKKISLLNMNHILTYLNLYYNLDWEYLFKNRTDRFLIIALRLINIYDNITNVMKFYKLITTFHIYIKISRITDQRGKEIRQMLKKLKNKITKIAITFDEFIEDFFKVKEEL